MLALSLTTSSFTATLCLFFLLRERKLMKTTWEGFSDNPETGPLESTDN